MTDERKQTIKKITITHDDRGWLVEAQHGPGFGVSGRLIPTHKTLGEALDYIKENYSLEE